MQISERDTCNFWALSLSTGHYHWKAFNYQQCTIAEKKCLCLFTTITSSGQGDVISQSQISLVHLEQSAMTYPKLTLVCDESSVLYCCHGVALVFLPPGSCGLCFITHIETSPAGSTSVIGMLPKNKTKQSLRPGLPYITDRGACQKFWKEAVRCTKSCFVGLGFFFSLEIPILT